MPLTRVQQQYLVEQADRWKREATDRQKQLTGVLEEAAALAPANWKEFPGWVVFAEKHDPECRFFV